jgi:CheY-like chemotaxis protein
MKTVLILEDDLVTRQIWESSLKKMNSEFVIQSYPNVDGAINDHHTIEQLSHYFDLVIVDIFLAGDVTGIQLVSEFSKMNQKKVVVSSSIGRDEFESLCAEFKLDCAFVQKPLHSSTVFNTIRKILGLGEQTPVSEKIQDSTGAAESVKRDLPKRPVVFITGCASGIGSALAEKVIANKFYRVVITAREKSIQVLREKYFESERLKILPLDLTDFTQIKKVVSSVLTGFSEI